MTFHISIPHRSRDESLVDVASHARHLGQDDARVTRQIVLSAWTDGVATSAGELLDHLGDLEPHQRRAMLDQARADVGLPATADMDASRPRDALTVRTVPTAGFPSCAVAECNAAPMRLGIFYTPDVKRWHCPEHEHLADPGDLEPRVIGMRLSPAGVPIDDDPTSDDADRARDESRRAQLQAEDESRAVEAAADRASKQAADAAHLRELPEHLRRMADA